MKLTQLETGKKANVFEIKGDRRYLSRITSIGINIGCKIEMLQNKKRQPVLIYCRDTMVALNRDESENIIVEERNE